MQNQPESTAKKCKVCCEAFATNRDLIFHLYQGHAMVRDSQYQHNDPVSNSLATYDKLETFKNSASKEKSTPHLNENNNTLNSKLASVGIQDLPPLSTQASIKDTIDLQNLSKNNEEFKKAEQSEAHIKDLPKHLPCLLCGNIFFPSLFEYQRHLAFSHFSENISSIYLPDKNETKFTCTVCLRDSNKTMVFANKTFLILHLATFHNCCLEFASETVINQLKYV